MKYSKCPLLIIVNISTNIGCFLVELNSVIYFFFLTDNEVPSLIVIYRGCMLKTVWCVIYDVINITVSSIFLATFRLLSAIFFRGLPLDGDTVVIKRRRITLVCDPRGRALGWLFRISSYICESRYRPSSRLMLSLFFLSRSLL